MIEGFGACFNELGWTSLSLLSEADRNSIMKELFLSIHENVLSNILLFSMGCGRLSYAIGNALKNPSKAS
ncbi:hypothetical protein, partial [uncultured Phocaeicola sp.]|uniref:hypothetical protein n=1 Tax=uncultured Phocaeicola sp. TaxID=990718 RepID=UPI0026144344